MKLYINSILIIALFINLQGFSQSDSSANLNVSAYVEMYYTYDFAQPDNHQRPDFLYSYNRHNEFNLNMGYIQLAYDSKKIRSNFALMSGTYANSNLAHEPSVLRNIYEANVGIKLHSTKNLWLDAGVFASHIGFESAIGADCWTLTRSISAENSPYYLSGAKITYMTPNENWVLSALLLNGWQRIQRLEGNNTPAFGHQISWMPTVGFTFNSSSFIGSDTPDSVRRMRYFHDFYAQMQFSQKLGLIAGFDIGVEQKQTNNDKNDVWYTPVAILRYRLSEKIFLAGRVEHFTDRAGLIVPLAETIDATNGFNTMGYSINVDYEVYDNVLVRLEGRTFNSKERIFVKNNTMSNTNTFVATSISCKF